MAVPSNQDIKKHNERLAGHFKHIGEDGKTSERDILKVFRSSVRQTWMRHPVKLAYLESGVIHDLNPNTRTKWLVECECCKRKVRKTEIEIDHKNGEYPLLTFADAEPFIRSVLHVTFDDLQRMCKTCHGIKTYAERYGMTFELAKIEKEVIQFFKDHKKVDKQVAELKKVGIVDPNELKSLAKRKDAYRNYLLTFEEKKND